MKPTEKEQKFWNENTEPPKPAKKESNYKEIAIELRERLKVVKMYCEQKTTYSQIHSIATSAEEKWADFWEEK